MKTSAKLRTAAMALLAIAGLTAYAFTEKLPIKQPAFTQEYFKFIGTSSADQSNPNMYVLETDPGSVNCPGGSLNCLILATPQSGNPNRPDLTQNYSVEGTRN
jgi:hypothetical protein